MSSVKTVNEQASEFIEKALGKTEVCIRQALSRPNITDRELFGLYKKQAIYQHIIIALSRRD